MPSIDVAMAGSLRAPAWSLVRDSLVRGIVADLAKRDIVTDAQDKASDVAKAFSSWDNCMAAAYCKYPVIAVIAIGGLIILAVVICIVRCACMGMSCCCSCFRCLKCCGNCCGCFDPPGGRRHKYLDEPYIPPHQGYRAEEPMQSSFHPAAAPTAPAPPQYAEFDVSKKGGEDALPAMPSWEGAASSKVALEDEEHEMDDLKKTPHQDPNMPLMSSGPSGHTSPLPMESPNPYGQPYGNHNGYMPAPGRSLDPYSPQSPGYNHFNAAHDSDPDGYGLDQPYDSVPTPAIMPGRQSPALNYNGRGPVHANQGLADMPGGPSHMNQAPVEMPAGPVDQQNLNGYGQAPPRGPPQGAPQGYGMRCQGTGDRPDGYGMRRTGTGDRMGGPAPYGMDPRARNSPGPGAGPGPRRPPGPPQGDRSFGASPRRSPGPQQGLGYGQPPRDNFNRTYSPAPDRQNSSDSTRPLNRPRPERPYAQGPPQSPITNNSGFDFNSGFSRPRDYESPQPSPTHEAYPGYKPYQPSL